MALLVISGSTFKRKEGGERGLQGGMTARISGEELRHPALSVEAMMGKGNGKFKIYVDTNSLAGEDIGIAVVIFKNAGN